MTDPQQIRAQKIATQLGAGPNPSRSLIKAIQALVEADERYIEDAPPRWRQPLPPPPAKENPDKPETGLTLF